MAVTFERRQYPRLKKQLRARYVIAESKRGGDECSIIDTSLKGLGVIFHTEENISVGSTIILEIPVAGNPDPYCVKGTIRWVNRREDGYRGGIELSHLCEELPKAQSGCPDQPGSQEQRVYIRFSTSLRGRYFIKGSGKNWGRCTVFDISRKGMGITFHTAETIPAGSTITIEIDVPTEREPMSVKGILRWLKQVDNESVGGIELTEVLDEIKSLIIMLQA